MKKEFIKYGLLTLILLIVFIFIYPTIYRYDKLEQRIPVRINRITGKTELLSAYGWNTTQPIPSPDPAVVILDPTTTPQSFNDFMKEQEAIIKNLEVKLKISTKAKPVNTGSSGLRSLQEYISAAIYNGNSQGIKSFVADINIYKNDGSIDFERKYQFSSRSTGISPYSNGSMSIDTDFDIDEGQKFDFKILSVELVN